MRCRCGHREVRKKQTLLRFIAPGHSEQHSATWCADIERWHNLQRLAGAAERGWKWVNGQPHPMLVIHLHPINP
jgi:hypothetical protein